MSAPNVLRVNGAEEQADYTEAVAEMLRRIQAEHVGHDGKPITLCEIAECIDVSLGTISNAANKKGVLNPLYLGRLGKRFGVHTLDPFVALAGGRVVALKLSDRRDVLPFLNRAALKIAEARDPAGPGGEREVHCERFGYLPLLRETVRESQALIAEIEAEERAAKGVAA